MAARSLKRQRDRSGISTGCPVPPGAGPARSEVAQGRHDREQGETAAGSIWDPDLHFGSATIPKPSLEAAAGSIWDPDQPAADQDQDGVSAFEAAAGSIWDPDTARLAAAGSIWDLDDEWSRLIPHAIVGETAAGSIWDPDTPDPGVVSLVEHELEAAAGSIWDPDLCPSMNAVPRMLLEAAAGSIWAAGSIADLDCSRSALSRLAAASVKRRRDRSGISTSRTSQTCEDEMACGIDRGSRQVHQVARPLLAIWHGSGIDRGSRQLTVRRLRDESKSKTGAGSIVDLDPGSI